MFQAAKKPGSRIPPNPLLFENPFHMQKRKAIEEFYMAGYGTVCYRLEWKSRSSASQGAVERHCVALQYHSLNVQPVHVHTV